jgi:hypothetical protein
MHRHNVGDSTMAKRSSTPKRTTPTPSSNALERQVIAFAEQLGYVAGSIESRTEGWMDRKKLNRQITTVRDGAKQLLEQLATGVASRVRRRPSPKRQVRKARSGGTVDAPGKKHRKPAPAGPPEAAARTRNALMRGATHITQASHRARQG